MKTALISVTTGALVTLGFWIAGRPFDVVAFVVIVFGASIVAWTVEQYNRPDHLH